MTAPPDTVALARIARLHAKIDDGLAGFADMCGYADAGEQWAIDMVKAALCRIGSAVAEATISHGLTQRQAAELILRVMRETDTRRPDEHA